MALTPEGTPYVESTDLVANYPAASLSLANRVDLVGVLPFATSAARSTAIPSPTDGQYSYLQDSNSTEFWNGSAWVAAGTAPGVVLVAPTSIANSGGSSSASGGEVTFTTVNSVSLNGVFTATYDNYRVIINCVTSATTGGITIRARNAGTDVTGATEYYNLQSLINNTGGPVWSSAAGSSFTLGLAGDVQTLSVLDFGGPFLSTRTVLTGSNFERSSVDARLDTLSGARATVAAHDGLTISISSGTMTGKVRVYGYKNS